MSQTFRKISQLKLWSENPRAIKESDFKQLKERVKRWGQFKPVLITPDNEVIGGNMRLRAYMELGIEDVWVSVVNPKTEAEKIEIALADNENLGYYEDDKLAELISKYKTEIKLENYTIDVGVRKSLDDLLNEYQPDEVVEDETPELTEEAISKLGEVYQLGRHRLMCGDSTKIEDVEKLMNGNKADMVFTDPPYGMNAVSNSGVLSKTYGTDIMNDDTTQVAIDCFNMCQAFGIEKQIWWGANYYCNILTPASCWLVWDKNNGEVTRWIVS